MQREYIASLDWVVKALMNKDKLRHLRRWRSELELLTPSLDRLFYFLPGSSGVTDLPLLSFIIHIPFYLQKSYLSKDDTLFHILDNPVRKEHVFKVPMIAATQWKGALRAAMTNQLARWWMELGDEGRCNRENIKEFLRRRLQLIRLFGTEKGVGVDDSRCEHFLDELLDGKLDVQWYGKWHRRLLRRYYSRSGFFAGRLYFYPTYFERLALEVINPHPRDTGAGSNPILFESVPAGAKGTFQILYVPMDHLAMDKKLLARQMACDLEAVTSGVKFLLTEFGFGAKTSSGYGRASNKLLKNGKLDVHCMLPDESESFEDPSSHKPKQVQVPKYLEKPGLLKEEFRNEEGGLKSEEEYKEYCKEKGLPYNKKRKQDYEKAKKWWEREGEALWQERHAPAQTEESEPELELTPLSPVMERMFGSLDELYEEAKNIAQKIEEYHG